MKIKLEKLNKFYIAKATVLLGEVKIDFTYNLNNQPFFLNKRKPYETLPLSLIFILYTFNVFVSKADENTRRSRLIL